MILYTSEGVTRVKEIWCHTEYPDLIVEYDSTQAVFSISLNGDEKAPNVENLSGLSNWDYEECHVPADSMDSTPDFSFCESGNEVVLTKIKNSYDFDDHYQSLEKLGWNLDETTWSIQGKLNIEIEEE